MKPTAIAALALVALVLSGCGDDEPEEVSVPTTIGTEFDTLDANGDSYLDADEIDESSDRLFDAWDADADSELDPDEIAGNAFKLWDADNSGTVLESEWKSATELWYPSNSELVVFSDWDADGDSELDADEFSERFDLSALGESWTQDSFNKSTFKNAYFELYDSDDDGKVTEVEWRTGSSIWGTPPE